MTTDCTLCITKQAMMSVVESVVVRLKEHLALRSVNHEQQLMSQPTLKMAHVYCILADISAQKFGPLIEKWIIAKQGYTKNAASICQGDCRSNEGTNIEIKASLGGAEHCKFNYVQIRLSQDIQEYLLTAYHLTGENVENAGDLYVFRVPKQGMKTLILNYGGYAHGTKKEHGAITQEDLDSPTNTKEYAIRPAVGDACWIALQDYRCTAVAFE